MSALDFDGWAVVNRAGDILVSTVSQRRDFSIKLMVGSEPGHLKRWRHWRERYGCRCIKVRVFPAV